MADQEAMQSYAAGKPVPTVDPDDIRRFREVGKLVVRDKPAEGCVGIDIRLFSDVCTPGANIPAVAFRSYPITILLHLELLNPWHRGDDLDDAVYRVAAVFPLAGIERFNPSEFLARLRQAQ